MQNFLHTIFGWLLLTTTVAVSAQTQRGRAVEAFVASEQLRSASVSFCVLDVSTGQVIAQHDPLRSLAPASALKTVTTASALALLGPNYQFKTTLSYTGTLDGDGSLAGDLYLQGFGDPTFGSDQMAGLPGLEGTLLRMVQATQQSGIRAVEGRVFGDGSYFETAAHVPTWQWNDLGNYYGAGAFGLNINENLYQLHFTQTAQGEVPPISGTTPPLPDLNVRNEVLSAGPRTGDNAYIYGAHYTNERYVRGTIPAGSGTFTIKGSIPEPPLTAARLFAEALAAYGVEVDPMRTNAIYTPTSALSRVELFTFLSPPLREIVKRTNVKSVNLYCEAMLKTIGAERGQMGSREEGLRVIEAYWKDRGWDVGGLHLQDGSGLSARNAVSAFHLAQLLQLVHREPDVFSALYDSLPTAAQSGSLRQMWTGTPMANNLRAKSGTLSRVRSYAGYFHDRNGKLHSFAILVNNYEGSWSNLKQSIMQLMTAMY